jgi:hypothetical protein
MGWVLTLSIFILPSDLREPYLQLTRAMPSEALCWLTYEKFQSKYMEKYPGRFVIGDCKRAEIV